MEGVSRYPTFRSVASRSVSPLRRKETMERAASDVIGAAEVNRPPQGHYVITSIDIRRFRCFKELKQLGLRRFNFIVGDSGTGKTALLEALFLAGGANAEIYLRVRRFRGFGEGGVEITGTRAGYESLFRDLFYRFDSKQGTLIKLRDSGGRDRSLEIFYKGDETLKLPLKSRIENAFIADPINFKWETPTRVFNSQIEIKDGRLEMTGTQEVYPIVFVSPQTMSGRVNAIRYSELSVRNAEKPLLTAMQAIFEDVQEITLENVGNELILHVSLRHLEEKLPLADLSGGVNKYLSIVIAILTNPGGVVLIDEIEDGFYYKNLPVILRTLVDLCIQYEVQLFATTHSYEFLQVLSRVIEEAETREEGLAQDFTLMRLERSNTYDTSLTLVRGDTYKAAIDQSFEVR